VYFLCPAFLILKEREVNRYMEQTLMDLAAANGLWAALFVFLFIYVLYDSRRREQKYQDTIKENQCIINKLSEKFGIVEDIQRDVLDIKNEISRR